MQVPRPPKGVPTPTLEQTAALCRAERAMIEVALSFGYQELRLPVLEHSDLFRRSVGAGTDIVEKEMYEFPDGKGEMICLRPEGTAGCVAAGLRSGLISHGQRQRLWYSGPFFRRERPQQGRYRQFHQVGVEALGYAGENIDVELLIMTATMWDRLDLHGALSLRINSLGTPGSRRAYREALLAYLVGREDELDEVARKRMRVNPMRVLDSKSPATQRVVHEAPKMRDYLDDDTMARFERLKGELDELGIGYEEDQRLVRGLDYYTGLVFEWVTSDDKRQNAVCAGGRYDGLVELLGGGEVAASGFAIGVERVAAMLGSEAAHGRRDPRKVYIVSLGESAMRGEQKLARLVRRALPAWKVVADCANGTMKAQLKRADKYASDGVLIVGDGELARGEVTVKRMSDGAQERVAMDDAVETLRRLL